MLCFEFHLSLETEFLGLQLWGKTTRFYKPEVNQHGNISSWYSMCLEAVSRFCWSQKHEFSSQILLWKLGNTRLGSSYTFLEHQQQWVISEKHEMNREMSANTSTALPPWIWECVSQMCWHGFPKAQAGICHHRLAELPQQCWISSSASVLGRQSGGFTESRGFRTPRFRWDLQLCLPWEPCLALPWEQAEASGSGGRHSLARGWQRSGLCYRSVLN